MNSTIHSALAREDFNERVRRAEAHRVLAARTRRGYILAALPGYRSGGTSRPSGSK